MLKAFDFFAFDDNSRDWSAEIYDMYAGFREQGEKATAQQMAKRVVNTKPTHSLAAYAGNYSDPYWGDVKVVFKDNKLHFQLGNENHAQLKHWHHDVFQADWDKKWWGKSMLQFHLNPIDGSVESLSVNGSKYNKE